MIVLDTCDGLANRMQAISSAIALSHYYGHQLTVLWEINSALGCKASDLFDTRFLCDHIYYFKNSNEKHRFLSQYVFDECLDHYGLFSECSEQNHQSYRLLFQDHIRFLPGKCIYVRTYMEFFPAPDPYQLFEPKHAIQCKIADHISFAANHAGIQIRRTDNKVAIDRSKIEYFTSCMTYLLSRNIVSGFFVATDCDQTLAFLLQHFPVSSISGRCLDRGRKEGITDAVVDLYCLSKTRLILGSYGSTFCHVAARLGTIPLILVGAEEAEQARNDSLLTRLNNMLCCSS